MDTEQLLEAEQLIKEKKTFPSISIIIPTNTKYPHFKHDEEKLKLIVDRIETKILDEFPPSIADPLIARLSKVYQEIDFTHLSKGLAIYVSREQEKIFHLSFPVVEKVIIDKSFEIRDLLYATKHTLDYLVLLISSNGNKLFKGFNGSIEKIKLTDAPKNVKEWKIDLPTKTGNFTDAEVVKDETLEKYLHDIDNSLSAELKTLDFPVVIFSVERIIAKYKNITKNQKSILDYVTGNFEHATIPEILDKLEVVFDKKNAREQEKYLNLLDEAIGKDNFASGINEVWRVAMEQRGRLLLVEKNYSCAAKYGKTKYTLVTKDIDKDSMYTLKDAVDDLIEVVLKFGGDVVFVDDGKLLDHNRIALITYF